MMQAEEAGTNAVATQRTFGLNRAPSHSLTATQYNCHCNRDRSLTSSPLGMSLSVTMRPSSLVLCLGSVAS